MRCSHKIDIPASIWSYGVAVCHPLHFFRILDTLTNKTQWLNRRALLLRSSRLLSATPLMGIGVFAACSKSGKLAPQTSAKPSNSSPTPAVKSTWLSGGTQAMRAAFPPPSSPFGKSLGNWCQPTEAMTLGPCFFEVDEQRHDISEGQAGVPMTLAIKLVNAKCQALPGAVVEVWYCNAQGRYSADNSAAAGKVAGFASGFCSGNHRQALKARWFRGIKTSDAAGELYFKTCFPGWYPGRTTHIHFRVVLNGRQQLISQFTFDDTLCNDIYRAHPDYTGIVKDTSNADDWIFHSDKLDAYTFEIQRQVDGSMLAYKAIQLPL